MADEEHSNDVDVDDGQDFEDVPDEIDDDLLEEDAGDDIEADVDDFAGDDDDDDDLVDDDEEAAAAPATPKPAKAAPKARRGDDDEEEDDDEDVSDDDVEADLDTILKDRIAAQPDDDEDEEDGTPEPDERGDGAGRIQPRRPGEFVCQSCFLVKHPSQLADADNQLCADCV
jgi:hypothetical protein